MGTLYVGWEEVVVSNEKGKREVHYLLKRRDGKGSDLAVVGRERTARHMFYSFVLRHKTPYSAASVPPPNAKLKSRREVLDWLSSVVPDSYSLGSTQKLGPVFEDEALDFGISSLQDSHKRKLEFQSKEFAWVGSPSTCRKRRKHYPSFCRNGITISAHDFVYVLAEENKRLVAYLEDLYEDSRGNRMVVVRWFHKIDEVGIILPPNFNDREIFFSLCLQDLSVECIDGLATVLSPQHFEKYLKEATHTHWQPFLCHRQFDNDDITDFEITQVKGYWKQEILGYMYTKSAPKQLDHKPVLNGVPAHVDDTDGDDDDDDSMVDRPRKKHRRSKSKEKNRGSTDRKDAHTASVNVQSLGNGLVSSDGAEAHGLGGSSPAACLSEKDLAQPVPQKLLAVGSHVEVLSQDSGIRGCWFRAMVIKKSKVKVKVRYEDIKDAEDETKNVEEWVLSSRIAASDELGIRLHGRNTIRPFLSPGKDGVSLGFVDLGTPVDAWWHDGWWEGIVVRKESESKIHVYFPGEKKLSIFGCNELRCSQEWLCNKWSIIDCRPDIVSSILSGLETKQDKNKSCDGDGHTIEPVVTSDEQLPSSNVVDRVSSKEERVACNQDAPPFEPQNGLRKHVKAVPNLAKDLSHLRWSNVRKRRRGRERSQRWSSGSSSSSREDMETSPDRQRYLTPNSLKFDHECCKYQGDSLLNVSIPPLTGSEWGIVWSSFYIAETQRQWNASSGHLV